MNVPDGTPRFTGDLEADQGCGVVAGWGATEADLPALRRQTHDTLIALMGDNRAGGVTWRTYRWAAAFNIIHALAETSDDPEWVATYRRFQELLDAHGGFLVVAFAPAHHPFGVLRRGAVADSDHTNGSSDR